MKDWNGPITNRDVAMRFLNDSRKLAARVGNAIQIYECTQWPDGTVGVLQGKPCMSSDICKAIPKITPEHN